MGGVEFVSEELEGSGYSGLAVPVDGDGDGDGIGGKVYVSCLWCGLPRLLRRTQLLLLRYSPLETALANGS